MAHGLRTVLISSALLLIGGGVHAAGLASHVTKIDLEAMCLSIEWNNDTERQICWKDTTRFSVLETGKPAKATDVRNGSYLRMEGEETAPWKEEPWGKEGQFWATEIVIWQEQSRPAKP
jgi:hypothetical protein